MVAEVSEFEVVRQTLSLILKNQRFLLYPLYIIFSAYFLLLIEVGTTSYFTGTVNSTLILPWTCTANSCQAVLVLNILIIISIFALNAIIASITIFAILALFLDLDELVEKRKRSMKNYLIESFKYRNKVFLLAFLYTLLLFLSFDYLGNAVPFYVPAPVPTFLIFLILKMRGKTSKINFLSSDSLISVLKFIVKFVVLTVIPFIYYNISGNITILVNSSNTTLISLVQSLIHNLSYILQQSLVAIIVFTVSGVYAFLAYRVHVDAT